MPDPEKLLDGLFASPRMLQGSVMETQLRRALSISNGDFPVFFTRPFTLVLLLLSLALLLLPTVLSKLRSKPN